MSLLHAHQYDPTYVAVREKNNQLYSKAENREVPFRICRRSSKVSPDKLGPSDAEGACAMCNVPVVYDREVTMDSKPKVCVPCALRLAKGGGLESLDALGTWEPTAEDMGDEEMLALLAKNVHENTVHDMNNPKYSGIGKKVDAPRKQNLVRGPHDR